MSFLQEMRTTELFDCAATYESIAPMNSLDVVKWRHAFCNLPPGIGQVVIDGFRGKDEETTSIAIDDVTIWHCSRYST